MLLKGFLFALTQQEKLPRTVLFYNGGAFVTCDGSASLEDLHKLEALGVEILTCGTCLNHYGIADQAPGGSGDQYVRHRREADERHPGDPALTRQRTPALVISFQETAQALAAEALFGRLSLPGRIIPLPSRISAGCGLAWKADPGDETVLTAALDENGIGHGPCCVLEMF